MKWVTPSGATKSVSDHKYRIDWNKPSRSKEQTRLKKFLYEVARSHLWFEEYPVAGTKLRIDFLSPSLKIAIEHQGEGVHETYNPHFHGPSRYGYLRNFQRDTAKRQFLEKNGYQLVETYTDDLPLLSHAFFEEKFGVIL